MTLVSLPIDFPLGDSSIATVPAERRGSGRDDVRLMVARRFSTAIQHDSFRNIGEHLDIGDVLVVNASATIPASLDAWTGDGNMLRVHFASPASDGLWMIEIRAPRAGGGTSPGPTLEPQTLRLTGGARAHLLVRSPRSPRLWVSAVEGTEDVAGYLQRHGAPIQYQPGTSWPIEDYQTVFSAVPGSVEMPSAARPFTPELVTSLISHGVLVVPIVLHAGVSSYEEGEHPGDERFVVPASTADVLNTRRRAGGRILAVGTTVVRALESVADDSGDVHPGRGVTDLIVTPQSGVHSVDGLLTGWHEPRSSHLQLLEAFLHHGRLQGIYDEAVANGYLWHEFGDELLILP